MVMVCMQALGNDGLAFAGSQGNFELNTMRPVVIPDVLHTTRSSPTRAEPSANTASRASS